tara:strand:- start:2123 stop:2893 length:771 start_codon:yes stop_codon:yes gene_type:complete
MELINQFLGWIIIIGTFITYSFQFKKLVSNKNVIGINDNMLLLGCASSMFNLLGLIASNIDNFGKGNLYFKILPIVQLFSPWLCLQINYHLYYIYENNVGKQTKYKLFNLLLALFVIPVYPLIIISSKKHHLMVADIFNIMSGILSVGMWIPQLMTTYRDKKAGTLSLLSVGLHAVGCLLVIIFQLLEKEALSTIIPYIIALLCESWIVYYCLIEHKRRTPIIEIDYHEIDVDNLQVEDDVQSDNSQNFLPEYTTL